MRLTYANVMATIAVFVALGGTSYAVKKIDGKLIKNGTVSGKKLKRNTLGGKQVKESRLGQVPSATRAESAESAATAARATTATSADKATNASSASNAGLLDGLDSSAFTKRSCNSQSGAVKGFARIDASASFPSTFTTTGVNFPYTCGGGTVQARRISVGEYEVRFNGSGSFVAVATPLGTAAQNKVVNLGGGGGPNATFTVTIATNGNFSDFDDEDFAIVLL